MLRRWLARLIEAWNSWVFRRRFLWQLSHYPRRERDDVTDAIYREYKRKYGWFSKLLRRLIGEKPPGFQYEALDSGLWRCLNCRPARIVWRDQLAYHATWRHGFKAQNVRIEPSR